MQCCAVLTSSRATALTRAMGPRPVLPTRPALARPGRRSAAAPPRAGPPPTPAEVWQPTGVPLVDDLAAFSSLPESGLAALKLIAIAAAGIYVAQVVLRLLGSKADEDSNMGNIFYATLASVAKPAVSMLPLYGWVYGSTVLGALAQVAAAKAKSQFNTVCFGNGPAVLKVIKSFTQLVQDGSEVILVIATAWALVGLKDRFVTFVSKTALKEKEAMARLLATFSGLLNYVIFAGAGFASLATCGINITPLLASVGGASVVIGLAAQSILSDVASALTLFASPPFAAGDDVKFLAGGALVVEGTIVGIEPLRCVLRTPEGSTLYIANRDVATFMVQNDSRKR